MKYYTSLTIKDSHLSFCTEFESIATGKDLRNRAIKETMDKWAEVWDMRKSLELYTYEKIPKEEREKDSNVTKREVIIFTIETKEP